MKSIATRRLTLLVSMVAGAGLLIAGVIIFNGGSTAPSADQVSREDVEQIPPPAPVIENVSSRVLFGGDVFWGRLFEREHPGDYEFPFSGLKTLGRENYDAWIVNVECPVTEELVSFEDQWEAVQFNCKPEYLEEAAKWFDVVSLANNHTYDVNGQAGLDITRANIEKAGIQHFGSYEPGILEDLCEVVSLDASADFDDGSTRDIELPVALCGYHGVFRTFTELELEYIKNYSKHFITIAMPHAGAEYKPDSDSIRELAYRALIDNGADAVLANHPHWIQNTESYKGKLIAYSMGNLIFDQRYNSEVTRSVMIDAALNLDASEGLSEYLGAFNGCAETKGRLS